MFQLYDKARQKRHLLTGLIKDIGRNHDCDLCIPDDVKISRYHTRLQWEKDGWNIVDMGSTNGTYLNGVRLEGKTKTRLNPGDIIEVGDSQLRYLPAGADDFAARVDTVKKKKIPKFARDDDITEVDLSLEDSDSS